MEELLSELDKTVVDSMAQTPEARRTSRRRSTEFAPMAFLGSFLAGLEARPYMTSLISLAVIAIVAAAFVGAQHHHSSLNSSIPSISSVPVELVSMMNGQGGAESAYNRAIALMRSQKYEQAKALFDEVLRSDPGDTNAVYNRAVCLQNLHRWEDALSDYSEFLRHYPKDDSALYNRAMCYMNLDRLTPALADLSAALEIHPSRQAYLNRAKVRADLGDNAGAVDDERRAKQLKSSL